MANINDITIHQLLDSKDETIKRNTISIKKQLGKLEDEFYQLRNDDPDFAINYQENDFFSWIIQNGIMKEI